jgi:hypothetical protein
MEKMDLAMHRWTFRAWGKKWLLTKRRKRWYAVGRACGRARTRQRPRPTARAETSYNGEKQLRRTAAGAPVDTRFVHIIMLTSSLLSGASSATWSEWTRSMNGNQISTCLDDGDASFRWWLMCLLFQFGFLYEIAAMKYSHTNNQVYERIIIVNKMCTLMFPWTTSFNLAMFLYGWYEYFIIIHRQIRNCGAFSLSLSHSYIIDLIMSL